MQGLIIESRLSNAPCYLDPFYLESIYLESIYLELFYLEPFYFTPLLTLAEFAVRFNAKAAPIKS